MVKILTLAIGILLSSTVRASGNTAKINFSRISQEVAAQKALLIDVREASEISRGMAAPAIWLATSEIRAESSRFKEIMKKIPTGKTVYIYCASGYRSGAFSSILKNSGYQAINIGGFQNWSQAQLPVTTPKSPVSKPCPYLCGK